MTSPSDHTPVPPEASPVQIVNETDLDLPFSAQEIHLIAALIEKKEKCRFADVELVFVDEQEIIRVNKEFLDKDYITDIISFRYDEVADNSAIEGSLVCCAPRITEQAQELNEPLKTEFLRIYIHGLLHLIGYNDQTAEEKKEMTRLENLFLELMK